MFLPSRSCLFPLRCHPSHSHQASYSALFFQQGSKRNTHLTDSTSIFLFPCFTSEGHTWAPHLTKRITVEKKASVGGKARVVKREGETETIYLLGGGGGTWLTLRCLVRGGWGLGACVCETMERRIRVGECVLFYLYWWLIVVKKESDVQVHILVLLPIDCL